jgi:hypothetical protein
MQQGRTHKLIQAIIYNGYSSNNAILIGLDTGNDKRNQATEHRWQKWQN